MGLWMICPPLLQVNQESHTTRFQVSSQKHLVSSKLPKTLGCMPLRLSPTPQSKRVLGHDLLSRERAQLRARGRGKTEFWDSTQLVEDAENL